MQKTSIKASWGGGGGLGCCKRKPNKAGVQQKNNTKGVDKLL